MVRIINSYTQSDPLAKVIASLGQTMFGDTVTPALKKAELAGKERENYGIDQVAKLFGSGSDIDPSRAAEFGILGGMKPDDLAMFNTYLYGNKYGPRDARTTNAMAGAGKYSNSAEAFDIGENNKIRMNNDDNATSRFNNAADNTRMWNQFLNEPKGALDANGNSVFAPQGDLAKPGSVYRPIPTSEAAISPLQKVNDYLKAADVALPGATPEQKQAWVLEQVSKAKSRNMTVYGPDGSPLVEFGGDGGAGPLTNANLTKVQADLLSAQQFDQLLDQTAKTVQANPNSVGAVGNVRGAVQSARIALDGFTKMVGAPSVDDALQSAQAEAIAMGVKPETFNFAYDPSLSEIETLYKMLAFQGIRTIGGQSGNDASDRDFKNILAILGDPNSWMTNAQDLQSKMKVVKKYVKMRTTQNRAALGLPPLPDTPAPAVTDGAGGDAVEYDWTPQGLVPKQ